MDQTLVLLPSFQVLDLVKGFTLIFYFLSIIIFKITLTMPIRLPVLQHMDPENKIKILDYTYTSQPSINTALPLKLSRLKLVLFIIGSIITSGFLWLLSKWSASKRSIFIYSVCDVDEADAFLIEEEEIVGGSTIVDRGDMFDIRRKLQTVRFIYHQRTYLYHEEKQVFLPIRYEELGIQLDKLRKNKYRPFSKNLRKKMLDYYGINAIRLHVQSKIQVFIQEMLTPYEVFQTYAILLWIYEEYYIFSYLLLAYSLYIYWQSSSEVTRNQKKLAQQSFFQVSCQILKRSKVIESHDDGHNSEDMSVMDTDEREQPLNEDKPNPMMEEIQPKIMDSGLGEKKMSLEMVDYIQPKFEIPIETETISSQSIVPGDIIILSEGDIVPCDCILLTGQILANESYISGQDYLIRKRPLQNFTYNKEKEQTFLLFMGTTISKVRNKNGMKVQQSFNESFQEKGTNFQRLLTKKQIACIVIQTNYNTLRGKYLRAIRYQKKEQESFTRQTIYFIYIILAITTIAFLILLPVISQGQKPSSLFITYLDLLSDSIPMTLPAALSVGIKFAKHRLKNYNIHLVLPSNILAAGRADTIVLDSCKAFGKQLQVDSIMVGTKTNRAFGNTYTSVSDFLDLTHSNSLTQSFIKEPERKRKQMEYINEKGKLLLEALSTCHTLQLYNEELSGTRQQKQLFNFTQASFKDEDLYEIFGKKLKVIERLYFKEKDYKLGVLVEYVEDRQEEVKEEMSLMEENDDEGSWQKLQQASDKKPNKMIFIKGPPEKILKICFEQTYPHNSQQYIVDMAEKGFKLVCYAYKEIEGEFNSETALPILKQKYIFLGFAILEMKRHIETEEAMAEMKKGNLHLMLISQDRELQTSSSAISNFVCSKNELLLCSKHHGKVICRGHTEWNSSGDGDDLNQFLLQSQDLIKDSYISLSSHLYEDIFMRRDEVNDPMFKKAIIFNSMENRHSRNVYFQLQKRGYSSFAVGTGSNVSECAHLSLELERGECSMLSSFHTPSSSLMTISNCLRVCRAALSTNFHCFSMMILFSLIQFTTVAILEYNYQCITDSQMLYEDLFVTFPIFVTINLTLPANRLSKQLPSGSFFSPRSLASMIGQFIIQLIAQLSFVGYMLSLQKFAQEKQFSRQEFLKTGEFVETDVALATFILTNYLYLGIVLSTSVSKPWRKPFYTNIFYTITLILLWLYNTGMVFLPEITIDDVRQKNKHKITEEMLVLATLLGNLVMLLMYLYENFLLWVREFSLKHKDEYNDQIQN